MKVTHPVSRRVLLRGAGASLLLPALESIGAPAAPPKRLIFLSYGWGVARNHWFPTEEGADYTMSECLKPLERHRQDFSVLSHLSNKNATQGHWGNTTWLTSARVSGGGGAIKNWVSVDQVAAQELGRDTRFSSLELSSEDRGGEGHGPGLSLSWSFTGSPIAGETSPLALFNRLFGAEEVSLEERQYLLNHDRSVLDTVMADAKSMHKSVSKADREKMEDYFQSVRDIETRLDKSELWMDKPKPKAPMDAPPAQPKPTEQIRLMYDLMAAAIRTDLTRVITYRQPVEGIYSELGFKVNGHKTTHCSENSDEYRASMARDQKQAELLAYLIDQLKDIKDADGSSAFDNSLIAYGSGIRTGHKLRDTPTLIAGHGGGGMNQGSHYVYESEQTPLANLWLGMLRQSGVDVKSFADSDGMLPGLFG